MELAGGRIGPLKPENADTASALVISHGGGGEAAGRVRDNPVERVCNLRIQLRDLSEVAVSTHEPR